MFTPEFLEQLCDIIAAKVFAKIEQRATAERTGLAEWLDRYGPVMTRDEVAGALKVSKRHVINLEKAGHIPPAVVLGKKALLEKEAVIRYLTNQQQKRQRYATSQ